MFKKMSGLYAAIVAMSLFVAGFPVGVMADSSNLVGDLNCGFETGNLSGWDTDIEPEVTSQGARTGSYGVKFTASENATKNLRYINQQYSNNQSYRFSGYVKAGDAASIGKRVKMMAQRSGGGSLTHGAEVRLTDEWQKISVEYSYPLESGQNYKVHIGPYVYDCATIYADDFVLEEITLPEFTVTTQVRQPEGMAEIEYAFSTSLKSALTENSFNINAAVAEKSISVNGNKYVLTLTGLTTGTEYTVSLIDAVTDIYDRTITQSTVTFTTPAASLAANGSFETGDLSGWDTDIEPEVTSQGARTGSYGVKFTASEDATKNLRYINQQYSNNQLYRFSGYVKAGDTASIGKRVKLMAQRSGGSLTHGAEVRLTDEWQKISVEYSYPLESGQNYKVHIGPYVYDCATIYADDFVLEEITPPGLSVETLVASVTQTEAVIKYTFSNPLVNSLTAEAFTVSDSNVRKEVTGEGKTYTLKLSGLSDSTEYVVTLAGTATDEYGGTVTGTEVTFTTTEPENILATLGKNPDFQTGQKDPWENKDVVLTVSQGTGINGSYGASYVSTGSNENMRLVNVPYEDGEYYIFSGYVKTDSANSGKLIALTAQQAGGGSTMTGSKHTLSTHWQKINFVFKLENKTSNFKAHLGVEADSGVVVYADDFSLMKYNPVALVTSNIENNQKGVSISQSVLLTFNNKIADNGELSECFSINDITVKSAVLSSDGRSITLEFNGLLKPNTEYTLTAKNVEDIYGGVISPFQIKFETGDALSVSQAPVMYKNGIAQSQLTPGEVTVKSTVQNNGKENCEMPVMIVTMYDENGFLIDVKATEFGSSLSNESGSNTQELRVPITITTEADYVAIHIWKAAGNISYMQTPMKIAVEN